MNLLDLTQTQLLKLVNTMGGRIGKEAKKLITKGLKVTKVKTKKD